MQIAVVYVSNTGVTETVVDKLKKATKKTLSVYNVKNEDPEMRLSDVVIIAAPVYIGRTHKLMRKWVKKHQDVLKRKHLIFVLVGGEETVNPLDTLKNSYPEAILKKHHSVYHCGGEFRFERMGFFRRFLIKLVIKSKQKESGSDALPTLNQSSINALTKAIDAL